MKKEKKTLEKKIEEQCPFTELKESIYYGIYMLTGDDQVSYICSLNGLSANGGKMRTSIPWRSNNALLYGLCKNMSFI